MMINSFRSLEGLVKEKQFLTSLFKNLLWLWAIKAFLRLFSPGKKLVVINLDEHIGDIVACEPVSRILRDEHPDDYLVWVTRYKYQELIRYNPSLNQIFGVTCLYEWMLLKRLLTFDRTVDLHIHERMCTSFNRCLDNPNQYGITLDNYYSFGTILETFMMAANLPPQDRQTAFYFRPGLDMAVPKDTIVFQCTSNEAVRNWDSGKFNRLSQRLLDEGYTVAEVGLNNCILLDGQPGYRNYCGKLDFQQIAKLIQKAALFVGIDSSFAHFANAVGTPGVVLLGHYRAFRTYMPYSGSYRDGTNAVIIQHDGPPQDIPEDQVYSAVTTLLQRNPGNETHTP